MVTLRLLYVCHLQNEGNAVLELDTFHVQALGTQLVSLCLPYVRPRCSGLLRVNINFQNELTTQHWGLEVQRCQS
jgi:hypothetical protein